MMEHVIQMIQLWQLTYHRFIPRDDMLHTYICLLIYLLFEWINLVKWFIKSRYSLGIAHYFLLWRSIDNNLWRSGSQWVRLGPYYLFFDFAPYKTQIMFSIHLISESDYGYSNFTPTRTFGSPTEFELLSSILMI